MRRTGPGRSSGKKRWVARLANRSRTIDAPVSVTVVTTSGSDGYRRRRPSTSGVAAIASPTDTAWIHARGGEPAAARPKPEPLAQVDRDAARDPAQPRRRRVDGREREQRRRRVERADHADTARSAAAVVSSSARSKSTPRLLAVVVPADAHGVAHHERAAREGRRDQERVPRAQPPRRARREGERHDRRAGERRERGQRRAARARRGPRGPSGTTTTSSPARSAPASARSASAPPREDEPRTTSRPKRRTKRASSSPSRERLASTRMPRGRASPASRAPSHGTMRMRPCQTA